MKIRTNFWEVWQGCSQPLQTTPWRIGYVYFRAFDRSIQTAFQKLKLHVKILPFLNHPVVALVWEVKAAGMAVVETNAVTETAEMTVKVDAISKRKSKSRDFEGKGKQTSYRTQWKENGFATGNKGINKSEGRLQLRHLYEKSPRVN